MAYTWLNKTEYPFQPHYFSVSGRQMHYIDEGQGSTILFVHGTPSWSFDYRHIIRALSRNHRCIAIDHIGFGLSDKPAEYDYATRRHSEVLEQFVLEHDLRDITLVVHDFGGPIGLSFAMQHPGRVSRLVIMNSWLWSSEADPEYQKLRKVLRSPLLPFLYRYLNFSPRFILPASFGDNKLPAALLQQYTAPFATSSERHGALAFARSLLHDQAWFEQLWQQRQAIAHKPTLFIWGMKDKVIRPAYLARFRQGFPNSHTVELSTAGHFPQEEQPGAVIEAIRAFLADAG